MNEHNLSWGSDTALPKLTDIHADAIVLSGLMQALSELEEIDTMQAKCGRASVLMMAQFLGGKLALDLDRVTR